MLSSTHRSLLFLFSLLVVCPAVAVAQMEAALFGAGPDSGISGTGTVAVKEQPTAVRMSIQLTEKAETLKEALARLKDRREAALLQLEGLGAKKDGIIVQPPTLSTGKTPQQQRMEQMLRMRQMQGRRVPKGLEVPKIVTITSTLTAEWPLDMKTQEEVLAFAHDLEDKVKGADLAGLKDAKDLSPEAEELDEEMQQMMDSSGYGEEEAKPGEPHFFYVAKLSDAARDKAMAEAFARAKSQAALLAKAAGIELGTLASLKGYVGGSDSDNSGYYYDSGLYRARMLLARQARQAGEDDQGTESLVPTPTTATFQIVVMASFNAK